jgi:hypothetical protein
MCDCIIPCGEVYTDSCDCTKHIDLVDVKELRECMYVYVYVYAYDSVCV